MNGNPILFTYKIIIIIIPVFRYFADSLLISSKKELSISEEEEKEKKCSLESLDKPFPATWLCQNQPFLAPHS